MKLNKKGQGMSINVIVIAALAILVLVVLSFLLIGKVRDTGEATKSCENNGGTCIQRGIGITPQSACGTKRVLSYSCTTPEETCCLAIE